MTPIRPEERNTDLALPLCFKHGIVAWRDIQWNKGNPLVIKTSEEVERLAQERDAAQAAREAEAFRARTDGLMYFVRINDLVKVGWTRDFHRRLKEYGAGAEVLCHYPATAEDETTLHRQLRPALAKGREWYHDGDVIQRYVTKAVDEFGPPTTEAMWTEPKNPVTLRHAD